MLFHTLALTMVMYLSLYSHCQPMTKAAPLSNSDHDGISISLLWNNRASPSVKTRTIWRYEYADFEKANVLINTVDWSLFYTEPDIDKAWELWLRTFLSIMNECIPKKTITQKCTLPWMNKLIQTKTSRMPSIVGEVERANWFSLCTIVYINVHEWKSHDQ